MKKILVTSLVVLAVLLGAVLVAPGLVDWNAYKGEIAARLGAVTGRAVELDGDIRLSLLPHPALTVGDARLASLPGAEEPDMIRLKRLDVQVALMPLLGGRIQVERVTLVEPTIVFEVLADGRFNWDLGGAARAAGGPMPGEGLASAISFDRVSIENGTVLYRDALSGRHERVEAVNARVVAGSIAGPFQIEGAFRLRGIPMTGELTAGRFAEAAAVPLRVSVALADTDATMRFAGIINAGKEGTRAQGDLRAEGTDLSRVAAAFGGAGGRPPVALAQPFGLRTTLEVTASAVNFAALEMQVGDTRASGTAGLRPRAPQHLDLTLAVNRLDVDAWLRQAGATPPAAPPSGGRAAAVSGAGAAGAGAGPGAAAGTPFGLELPDGMTARLDLAVDGVSYNGGVVRQGRLEASLAGGLLAIDRLSALLPGGSDLVAAGSLTTAGNQPVLDLRVESNADNLRGVLEWLRIDVTGIPADRLRKASLAAHIQGKSERVDISGLDLRVDTSRITGAIAYADHGRPAFGVRLDIDRLNLDAYGPIAGTVSGSGTGGGGTGASAAAEPPALRLLREVDANLELSVGSLVAGGVPVDGLRVDAAAAAGKLTLRDVRVADLAGVSARLSGQVESAAPLRGAHLSVSAEAASLSGLTRYVSWPTGAPSPERLGAVTLQGRLAGDPANVALELTLTAAGGTLEAGGTLSPGGTGAGDLKLRATHPELAQLARLFTDGVPSALGPLDLYAEVSGSPAAFGVTAIQGVVAGTAVTGEARVDAGGARPRIEADLQTGELDLARFTAAPAAAPPPAAPRKGGQSAGPAPSTAPASAGDDAVAWLRAADGRVGLTAAALTAGGLRMENAALAATLDGGVLTLRQFESDFYGGKLGASGRYAAPAGTVPEAAVELTVVGAALSRAIGDGAVDLAGGLVDLDATLTTSGVGRAAMLGGLSGQGRVAARDGVVRGFDLSALRDRLSARLDRPQDVLEAVLRGLQGGETRFARLDGTFRIVEGVARTDDMLLVSDVGRASAVGQVDLPADTIDMRVRVEPQAAQDLPPMTVRLTGPLARPTRAFEMAELQDFIARRAAGAVLERAVPGVVPVPVPTPNGSAPPQPRDVIRGLIEGLRR
ncbi:AsmA family protein [Azospirillum halopraeferens]|uniref:AsmA family protein n=1 Tax=Azospirillum halopraeferens TaxID=34010 RepID=UPI000A020503|nr:AsmA family protein [Azospirillum halopraeferens]